MVLMFSGNLRLDPLLSDLSRGLCALSQGTFTPCALYAMYGSVSSSLDPHNLGKLLVSVDTKIKGYSPRRQRRDWVYHHTSSFSASSVPRGTMLLSPFETSRDFRGGSTGDFSFRLQRWSTLTEIKFLRVCLNSSYGSLREGYSGIKAARRAEKIV